MPLTLAKETREMSWKERIGEQTTQILLEGDMIVPDSKPDLQEILRCEGKVTLRDKRISDDRISFSGELAVAVLYRAKNGEKPLYAMTAALPMEDFLHMDGLEKDMAVELVVTAEHLDCQIINDRKISVKAILQAAATAERKRTAEILTDVTGNGVECLRELLRTEEDVAEVRDRFTVKEEVTLPAANPEIGEVLLESLRLTEQDIRPMEGKALVRGNLCISLLYTDGEGNLGSLTEKIPFSGYLEQDALTPKTDLSGELTVEEGRLTPAVDEDGETRQLNVDVTIGAALRGKEISEQEVLRDAYAPEGSLSLRTETVTYPVTTARGRNQFTLKERIRLENDEVPMLRAADVRGDVRLSEARALEDAIEAEGVLTVDILYYCEQDASPVCLIRRGFPFTQRMEGKGAAEGDEARVSLVPEEIDFQMLSENEGELRATVTMEGVTLGQRTTELVTDVISEEEGESESVPMAGAVIYLVRRGDSLWKIAKRFRTTVADILAVNEIENPDLIYPGQKLLIIRMRK